MLFRTSRISLRPLNVSVTVSISRESTLENMLPSARQTKPNESTDTTSAVTSPCRGVGCLFMMADGSPDPFRLYTPRGLANPSRAGLAN